MYYKIEHNVPIPPLVQELTLSGALRLMKKGDSFVVPKAKRKTVGAVAHQVLGAGNYAMRSNGATTRFWRTK